MRQRFTFNAISDESESIRELDNADVLGYIERNLFEFSLPLITTIVVGTTAWFSAQRVDTSPCADPGRQHFCGDEMRVAVEGVT